VRKQAGQMNRRDALRTLGLGAAAVGLPGSVLAAGGDRIPRIAVISLHAPALAADVDGIRQELQKFGYLEGKTIEIESYFTNGHKQRTRDILKDLIDKEVDIIVPWTTATVQIAMEMTRSIPLVMIASDPVQAKLVQSLSRPGGNVTGVSMSGPDLAGKRLELLRELIPGIQSVAFLGFAPSPGAAAFIRESAAAGDKIGIKLVVRSIDRPDQLGATLFSGLKAEGAQALVAQPFFSGHAEELAQLGLKSGIPVISDYPNFPRAGALASLGVDLSKRVRRTAYFIDRILKGARPADLPVEQPTEFELAINVRTAKALGIIVPDILLARADEVIE
jgi:putative tryptophan/tyrosine transport system substrate-binding protein